MSRAVLRNAVVSRLLQRHCVAGTIRSPMTWNQTHFVSKGGSFGLSASTLFASSFSSSSSASRVGFVGWYLGMIRSRPILTKSVTCSAIYVAADFTSQMIGRYTAEEPKPYDFVRTTRMAGYGLLVLGPILHFWFNFMSKVCPKQDIAATFKKMFMGQTLYGPIMTVMFFSVNAGLQGENGGEIFARLKRDLIPTMLNGVMYWPLCDFITYKFTPVHLQRSGEPHFVEKMKNFVVDMLPAVKKPKASVEGVEFKELSRDGATYTAKISVDNPYIAPIPICEISYTLKSATRVIASGTMEDPGSLKGNAKTILDVPLKVPHDVLVSLAMDIGSDWDIDYVLEVNLTIDIPIFGDITIPLSTEGEIKLPTISDLF